MALIAQAKKLYQGESLAIDLDANLFALDSTTIDLCLTRFPWTPSQQSKAAVKMHVLLNLRGNIPDFIVISDGKTHDVNILDLLCCEPGGYYVMDRGYLDFKRLHALHNGLAFFVIREKTNTVFSVCESRPVNKEKGLRCDQTIRLSSPTGRKSYPDRLRRVKYHDQETDNILVFYTNAFDLPALVIAELYKQRWQVELFFKWVKQHLKIKVFYGHSENAVRTQLWIAVAVYCLLAIIRKEVGADREMHEIQEILSASIFQKMPILQAFSRLKPNLSNSIFSNQLSLF
jgi:IS4 transposase